MMAKIWNTDQLNEIKDIEGLKYDTLWRFLYTYTRLYNIFQVLKLFKGYKTILHVLRYIVLNDL